MSCNNNSTALPTSTPGASGRGVYSIIKTSGTGAAGTTDVYTITYTDGTTSTFNVLNGSVGTNGTNGTPGFTVLYNNTTVNTPVSGALQSLKSYTLPLNSLVQNGDYIDVSYLIATTGTTATKYSLLLLNGGAAMPTSPVLSAQIQQGANYQNVEARITRTSATTVKVYYRISTSGTSTYAAHYAWVEDSIPVANLTTNTNLIDIQGFTTAPDTIVCKELIVTLFKQ
jgi:hypothetical protein